MNSRGRILVFLKFYQLIFFFLNQHPPPFSYSPSLSGPPSLPLSPSITPSSLHVSRSHLQTRAAYDKANSCASVWCTLLIYYPYSNHSESVSPKVTLLLILHRMLQPFPQSWALMKLVCMCWSPGGRVLTPAGRSPSLPWRPTPYLPPGSPSRRYRTPPGGQETLSAAICYVLLWNLKMTSYGNRDVQILVTWRFPRLLFSSNVFSRNYVPLSSLSIGLFFTSFIASSVFLSSFVVLASFLIDIINSIAFLS